MTSVVLLDKAEAEALTARIQNAGNTLGVLLLEAFEREAWKALGYKSWKVYIEDRFTFNRQHSYRLLRMERVNRQLESGGSGVRVTEREARDLSPMGDTRDILHKVEERRQAVADIRAPLKDSKPKRGMRDTAGAFAGISAAVEFLEARVEGVDDEDVVAYLTLDQRRAAERAVTKAGEFAERWGNLLSRPIQRRETDEWASA